MEGATYGDKDTEEQLTYELREVTVEEYSDSTDSSGPGSSDEEEINIHRPRAEITAEYYCIQKLVKFIKTGNATATNLALCCVRDHDLTCEANQLAIQESGALEVLVNLLMTKDLNCKLGALSILNDLAHNLNIRHCIVDLGAIPALIKNLTAAEGELQIMSSELIYNIARIRKARKQIRKCDGISKLVEVLDVNKDYLTTPKNQLGLEEGIAVNKAKAAIRALWSATRCKKNSHILMNCGSASILVKLLRSIHMDVVIPTIGTICQCAYEPSYQLAIEAEGMITDIVRYLSAKEYPELMRYCAETIFIVSESSIIRDLVRQAGALDLLISIVKSPGTNTDKPLLAAVTGAIWKTAISPESVKRYDQLKTVECLTKLLEHVEEDDRVLCHVVGALFECLKFQHNRATLRNCGGLPYLVNLLNYTHRPLLEHVPMVLRECTEDEESMRIIEDLDGVRLIWSLLGHTSPRIQASAAWCLVPCVKYATDSAELVRSLVGGLELMVNLLMSNDNEVLASVCAAISEVAKDLENLAIITDYGVIPMLAKLVDTEDTRLREHLGSAIASCCAWGSNCKLFGRFGVITPLVQYMADEDKNVHRTAAAALSHLSMNGFNCVTMHESGVVPFLLKAVVSTDEKLQEAAAECLTNIRKQAIKAEATHLFRKKLEDEEEESSLD